MPGEPFTGEYYNFSANKYHEALGVTPTATPEEIRAAYIALSKQHHPDRGGDEEHYKLITEAYRELSQGAPGQAGAEAGARAAASAAARMTWYEHELYDHKPPRGEDAPPETAEEQQERLERTIRACSAMEADLQRKIKAGYGTLPYLEFIALIREQADVRLRKAKATARLGMLQHPDALQYLSKEDVLDLL